MKSQVSSQDEGIKLPGSSFEEVMKIVQGYAQANKPSSLQQISARTGIHSTSISRNAGFLVSIGIVEGGKNKQITPMGTKLGRALSLNLEHELQEIFREIVDSNEFLRNLLGALRIRKGMEEGAFKAHIAYSAGQAKSQSVMTGTGTVVELLKRASAVVDRDGKLVAVGATSELVSISHVFNEDRPQNQISVSGSNVSIAPSNSSQISDVKVNISIDIKIGCEFDDMDQLGEKVRKIISDIRLTGKRDDVEK